MHRSDKYIGQECLSCLELQDKVNLLSEALQRKSMQTADQIPASEFEFIIPKDQYEKVTDTDTRVTIQSQDCTKRRISPYMYFIEAHSKKELAIQSYLCN